MTQVINGTPKNFSHRSDALSRVIPLLPFLFNPVMGPLSKAHIANALEGDYQRILR